MGVVNFEDLTEDYKIFQVNGIFINEIFVKVLENNDLSSLDKVMLYNEGEVFRKNSVRCVRKIELENDDGKKHIFHLKTHKINFPEILKSFSLLSDLEDGQNEWNNILLLKSLDIKTMVPVAFGEVKRYGLPYKSFTITEHLYNEVRLEEYISTNFKNNMTKEKILLKRQITEALADVALKFHASGCNHNDFYLGHFFIKFSPLELSLIDLQRVHRRKKIRSRDRVKDIAQLYFSATQIDGVTKTDCFRFLKLYLDVDTFRDVDRDFIRKIIRKNAMITRHTKKVLGHIR